MASKTPAVKFNHPSSTNRNAVDKPRFAQAHFKLEPSCTLVIPDNTVNKSPPKGFQALEGHESKRSTAPTACPPVLH